MPFKKQFQEFDTLVQSSLKLIEESRAIRQAARELTEKARRAQQASLSLRQRKSPSHSRTHPQPDIYPLCLRCSSKRV